MGIKKFYLVLISVVSALGGYLFGYDWVVIGGAKPFYEVFFGISHNPQMQGWVMGSAIPGCLLGVIVSGTLADRYGRRLMLLLSAFLFLAASLGTGAVNSLGWFIAFRLLGGVGIGIASTVSPMYIAEIAPTRLRGKFVSINQLTIVLGILSAQLVNWLIAEPMAPGASIAESWNGLFGWRYMFWVCSIPALVFLVSAAMIPESPRWLAGKGRKERAFRIFEKVGGSDYAKAESLAVAASASAEKFDFRRLFRGKLSKILIVGVVLAVFQQWCGINVIFNYAQEIFAAAGYGVSDILFNIVITGVINVAFTFVGMYTVDKLGRRTLLLFGAIGLAAIYTALGMCYRFGISGPAVLILVVSAIACYAMSLAPVTWVVLSEIFPTRVRGMAMAVCTFSLWSACFLLTYTFPIINSAMGAHGAFWMYAVICMLGFWFVKKMLPETKGKSLETIEQEFIK